MFVYIHKRYTETHENRYDVLVDGNEQAVGLLTLKDAEDFARAIGATEYWNGREMIGLS